MTPLFALLLRQPAGWNLDTPLEHRNLLLAYAAVLIIQLGYTGWVLLQRIKLCKKK